MMLVFEPRSASVQCPLLTPCASVSSRAERNVQDGGCYLDLKRPGLSPCLGRGYSFQNTRRGQCSDWNTAFWWEGVPMVEPPRRGQMGEVAGRRCWRSEWAIS